MKKHRKVVYEYSCGTCGVRYLNEKGALDCEKKPIEQEVAHISDLVRIHERRICMTKSAPYTATGTIVEITPPMPPDQEYELKWLGGKRERLTRHTRQYVVRYKCPHCKEDRTQAVYAPEFTVLPKTSAKKARIRKV